MKKFINLIILNIAISFLVKYNALMSFAAKYFSVK